MIEFSEYEKNLQGMDRRTKLAEIILGMVLVFILNCAIFTYCKLYNKKKNENEMQLKVNEQVA
jgi:hypothetical protein